MNKAHLNHAESAESFRRSRQTLWRYCGILAVGLGFLAWLYPARELLFQWLAILLSGLTGCLLGFSEQLGRFGPEYLLAKIFRADANPSVTDRTGFSKVTSFASWIELLAIGSLTVCLALGILVVIQNGGPHILAPSGKSLDVTTAISVLTKTFPPHSGYTASRGTGDPEHKREYLAGVRVRTFESGAEEFRPYIPVHIRFSQDGSEIQSGYSEINLNQLVVLVKALTRKGIAVQIEVHGNSPAASSLAPDLTDRYAETLATQLRVKGANASVNGYGDDFVNQLSRLIGQSSNSDPYILIIRQ